MKWMDVKTGKRKEGRWVDIIPIQDETVRKNGESKIIKKKGGD
jgi:hypothetical protein